MLPDRDWICLSYILVSSKANVKTLSEYLIQQLTILEHKLAKAAAYASTQEWFNYVKKCISKGGSKLFAYVSKEVQAFMSIDSHSLQCISYSPSKHLAAQTNEWQARWHPAAEPYLTTHINTLLVKLRSLALQCQKAVGQFNEINMCSSLAVYPKETKGIDMWTTTELRSLPKEGMELVASAIAYSFTKAVQPIQNLTNLQAMLGKPGGGSRTVSKTPMLYRMSLGGRNQVE